MWRCVLGVWADEAEVDRLLSAHVPVILHGYRRPFRVLSVDDVGRWWTGARAHFEVPGSEGAHPDGDGLTYAAQVWARDGQLLLGFVEFC